MPKDALDVCKTAHADRCIHGAVHSVQELARGHDADGAVFVSDRRLDLCPSPLVVDEDRGVDQDGQALLGGPNASRPASMSRAKSSSSGGVSAISSRHCSAVIVVRARGGRSSAIAEPLRTISISSPAPTRFITREKLRATSVAVKRTMQSRYQINQISTPGAATHDRRGWR